MRAATSSSVCDELGLMVWQDFLFACACYPEEEPIFSEVVAEARDNVGRLTPHPSLVIWNGNNENLWLREPCRWPEQPGGDRTWGERYYLETLPAIVAELDPSRPYRPAARGPARGSTRPTAPTTRRTTRGRCGTGRTTCATATRRRDSWPSSGGRRRRPGPRCATRCRTSRCGPIHPASLHHQKAEDGQGKLARGLTPHFPEPTSTEAWHYLTQLNQVRAVGTGIAHWRSHWPHTAGTIVWQLNDLWPVISWAAIDGAGRAKPLYFALRELYAGRALTVQPRPRGWSWPCSTTTRPRGSARSSSRGTTRPGRSRPRPRWRWAWRPARSASSRCRRTWRRSATPESELVVASLDGVRALWFAVADRDFAWPDPGLTVTVAPVNGGLDLHVAAAGLARDILVQPDRMHPRATVDKGFVTLLPGETTVFRVRWPDVGAGPGFLDPAAAWVVSDLATVLMHETVSPQF